MSHRFSKKFVIPSFDCHIGATDLSNTFDCYTGSRRWSTLTTITSCVGCFPSSLKGLTLDWFYSLSSRYLWSFEKVSDAFFNQYASQ